MNHNKPAKDDPFSLFTLPESNNDSLDNWDPFAETLEQFNSSDESANSTKDPFAPLEFTSEELPQQHRRTISTPLRLISPQPVFSAVQTPINQLLPVAMSTCDFQNNPRLRHAPLPLYNSPPTSFMPNFTPFVRFNTIPINFTPDDQTFYAVCCDYSLRFNPRRIGFIPPNLWEDREMSFGECVNEFFQRKNNASSRFAHKLFNALRLSDLNPIYSPFVGVKWLNDNILRVDKRAFARLLGIKSIDGSLFHQQGNFPSHGFLEIGAGDVQKYLPQNFDLTGVDFENIRLLIHTDNLFRRGCTEAEIEHCRWGTTKK